MTTPTPPTPPAGSGSGSGPGTGSPSSSSPSWPVAALSPVARARALAAGLPGAGYAETTIDAPFAEAWPLIADLERSVPVADTAVRSLRVRTRRPLTDAHARSLDGPVEELRLFAWGNPPLPILLTARLEPGYCLMRMPGRLFVVVMAAEPDPDDPTRTRYGHVEVVARAVGRPLRRLMLRQVISDVAGFRRYVEERASRA